jgi:hypothetical protein
MARQCINAIALTVLVLCAQLAGLDAMAAKSDGESPLRSLTFTVQESQRDRFFDQLRKFADAEAFAVRIAPIAPDGKHFGIQLWRQDVKAIGDNALAIQEFDISFYENGDHPINRDIANELATHLKRVVSEIPGITISGPR